MIGTAGRLNSSPVNMSPVAKFGADPTFALNKGGFSAPHLPFAPIGSLAGVGPGTATVPRAVVQAVNVQTIPPQSYTQSLPDPWQTSEIPKHASGGLVNETRERAEEVKVNMEQIIGVLTTLATNHSTLKTKYLETRRSSLERYFVENKRILLQTAFMEWKAVKNAITDARRHSLVVDQLYQERETHSNLRQELESAFERKVHDIQTESRKSVAEVEERSKKTVANIKEELKLKTAQVAQLQKENDSLRARLGGQHKVLSSIREQLANLDEPQAKQISAEYYQLNDPLRGQEPNAYVKEKLHDILYHIDPKYVPPLQHVIALDSSLPSGSPHLAQFAKTSAHSGLSPRYKTSSSLRSQSANIQPVRQPQQNLRQTFAPAGFNRPTM